MGQTATKQTVPRTPKTIITHIYMPSRWIVEGNSLRRQYVKCRLSQPIVLCS